LAIRKILEHSKNVWVNVDCSNKNTINAQSSDNLRNACAVTLNALNDKLQIPARLVAFRQPGIPTST